MSAKFENRTGRQIKLIIKDLGDLPDRAGKVFKQTTPIKTGNARKNTRVAGNTIIAGYDYARRLDQGYSKQAPQGMVKPTLDFVVKELKKMFGRLK